MDKPLNNNSFSYSGKQLFIQLQEAGLLDEFRSKKLKCASCNLQLREDNIGCVLKNDSESKGIASCRDEVCTKNVKKWANIKLL